ncbi:MAG: PEP/pyruvate-binding domain-containing protein [Candidatus Woesebacteria bacterium]|jgi:phosphoenolpyruvate synthase/pyruvate phosphate dikinase
MTYIQPLSKYKFNLKAKKLEGLARLAQLNIPTVSNLFIVSTKLYFEFLETNKLSSAALRELKDVFNSIRKQGESITLRNSIYEDANPAIAFSVSNSLNLKTFSEFKKKMLLGFKKAIKTAIDPSQVEFSYLIQSFYSSEKCGSVLSDNGQGLIYLQAILGQHSKLLLRGDIEPDVYEIKKGSYKILKKQIAKKEHRIKKMSAGTKKVRVRKAEQNKAVLTDDQVKRIAKLSQVVERSFGPQEMEWAVLDSGKILFQETRDFQLSTKISFTKRADVIFPARTQGEVVNLKKMPKAASLSDKIVVTNNLNISFINKLAFLHRPKAVILTKGSVTAHAATVLRESKVTTILARDIQLQDGEKIQIEKDGSINKLVEK